MSFRNFVDKLRLYFWFSKQELFSFFWVVLAFGFVVSFNWWGEASFDWRQGLWGLLGGILLMAVTVFVHHAGQRLVGISMGFRVEQHLWWYGLVGSILFVFVSYGRVMFLAASSTTISMLDKHRLGKFRHDINMSDLARVCAAGPIANVLFGGLIKTLSLFHLFPVELANTIFTANLVFAAWNLIPVPPLDGSKVMFFSRLTYAFLFGTIAGYAFLVYVLGVYSYVWALVCGIGTWIFALLVLESGWGG